jgi:type IV pilus assembly protein PilQ
MSRLTLDRALRSVAATTLVCAVAALASPMPGTAQARRMSATWTDTPIRDVLRAFAAYSGASIVAAARVSGTVTADINDQPWDVALRTILATHGLVAREDAYGIIRVDDIGGLHERETVEPVLTRSYRISYTRAAELQAALAPLLSPRGAIALVESTNTLVVSDIARVQDAIDALLR